MIRGKAQNTIHIHVIVRKNNPLTKWEHMFIINRNILSFGKYRCFEDLEW